MVKDQLTFFQMIPASSGEYDDLVDAGLDPDEAYDLIGALDALEPEDGAASVSDLQKWGACVDMFHDGEPLMDALSVVMSDSQFQKVEIANDFGVGPDTYVSLYEILPEHDEDGNGRYKNDEVKAAIDALPGRYSTSQKAALWQLATGSSSAKNNPYSQRIGEQILEAKKKAKTQASTTEDFETFGDVVMGQIMGNG